MGSPPRVRGKLDLDNPNGDRIRITPACAGKIPCTYTGSNRRWDHPRVCGENTFYILHKTHLQGSPPRVRGKSSRIFGSKGRRRITPACAGKIGSFPRPSQKTRDHPRVCGENTKKIPKNQPFRRSSFSNSFNFGRSCSKSITSSRARCCTTASIP